jgi:kinesin family protein 15
MHAQVYDLLDLTNDVLAVKWDAKAKTFVVSDLLPVECRTIDDVTTVLAEGYRNRRIGSTALNKESSRSHRWVVGLCIAVKF